MLASATWIPLRAARKYQTGDAQLPGHVSQFWGCGSAVFSPEHRGTAEKLGWNDIGISRRVQPYAYKDGHYCSIEQYEASEKEAIGFHLVFEQPQPVIGGTLWILNPDVIVALRLIKEGLEWVRPEENFVVVAREVFDEKGNHCLIEIKREFLIDYLAARGSSLRVSYYRQRVENVETLDNSAYAGLVSRREPLNGGKFALSVRKLDDVYGGSWAAFRSWRTDFDEGADAPVLSQETDKNTNSETSTGRMNGAAGVQVESEFWRDEWIDHQGQSVRVRGDADHAFPSFIVGTDGLRLPSSDLNNEDIRRWLWFRSDVVNELLRHRGFSQKWYTAETGGVCSTSGHATHFGINSSELITVYAYDVARLACWEQLIWCAYNVVPEGGVSKELIAAQVNAQPAPTEPAEHLLFKCIEMLEKGFKKNFDTALFTHAVDLPTFTQQITRFASTDQASLLRLAKNLIRLFSDRINVKALRKLSNHAEKGKFGSNRLLEDVLGQRVGHETAHRVFGAIAGAYEMRLGDAHPTSSKIGDALKLAGIDASASNLRQGMQLISNFGQSVWWIGKLLFDEDVVP